MDKNLIQKAAEERKAVKFFDTNKKISNEDFEFLLEIARLSPSSFGLEPWNILVVQNQELRNELIPFASGAVNQLLTASHFVIFTIKTALEPTSKYFEHINRDVKQLDSDGYDRFIESFSAFSEQKLNVYDDRSRQDWAKKQAYIAMANMILAAAEIGINSCPIEGFFIDKIEQVLSDNNIIDINESRVAVMVALGYQDETHTIHEKCRRPMQEIVKIIN